MFLIRGDGPTMVDAGRAGLILSIPVEEVSLGSPRVGTIHVQAPTPHARRLRSVDTYRQGAWQCAALKPKSPMFWIQSSPKSSKNRRMRRRRLPDLGPIPEGVREPICPRKKYVIWTRWRPVPVKNVNYPRAPSSRRSGLVGPHTTPAIVNYKYMTSTL